MTNLRSEANEDADQSDEGADADESRAQDHAEVGHFDSDVSADEGEKKKKRKEYDESRSADERPTPLDSTKASRHEIILETHKGNDRLW